MIWRLFCAQNFINYDEMCSAFHKWGQGLLGEGTKKL